jgi:hypothetical protein
VFYARSLLQKLAYYVFVHWPSKRHFQCSRIWSKVLMPNVSKMLWITTYNFLETPNVLQSTPRDIDARSSLDILRNVWVKNYYHFDDGKLTSRTLRAHCSGGINMKICSLSWDYLHDKYWALQVFKLSVNNFFLLASILLICCNAHHWSNIWKTIVYVRW